jgi:hypothetical protein
MDFANESKLVSIEGYEEGFLVCLNSNPIKWCRSRDEALAFASYLDKKVLNERLDERVIEGITDELGDSPERLREQEKSREELIKKIEQIIKKNKNSSFLSLG